VLVEIVISGNWKHLLDFVETGACYLMSVENSGGKFISTIIHLFPNLPIKLLLGLPSLDIVFACLLVEF